MPLPSAMSCFSFLSPPSRPPPHCHVPESVESCSPDLCLPRSFDHLFATFFLVLSRFPPFFAKPSIRPRCLPNIREICASVSLIFMISSKKACPTTPQISGIPCFVFFSPSSFATRFTIHLGSASFSFISSPFLTPPPFPPAPRGHFFE